MFFHAPPPVITAGVFATVTGRPNKSGDPSTGVDADQPASLRARYSKGPRFIATAAS
jgi:hypothetical protein